MGRVKGWFLKWVVVRIFFWLKKVDNAEGG